MFVCGWVCVPSSLGSATLSTDQIRVFERFAEKEVSYG